MWIFRAIIARPRFTIGRKMLQKYIVVIHSSLVPTTSNMKAVHTYIQRPWRRGINETLDAIR